MACQCQVLCYILCLLSLPQGCRVTFLQGVLCWSFCSAASDVVAGCVLCALKRPEEAKEAFFAAIESSPQHVEVIQPPPCMSSQVCCLEIDWERLCWPTACQMQP